MEDRVIDLFKSTLLHHMFTFVFKHCFVMTKKDFSVLCFHSKLVCYIFFFEIILSIIVSHHAMGSFPDNPFLLSFSFVTYGKLLILRNIENKNRGDLQFGMYNFNSILSNQAIG